MAGDLEGARVLNETIGRLLGTAAPDANVVDLGHERRRRAPSTGTWLRAVPNERQGDLFAWAAQRPAKPPRPMGGVNGRGFVPYHHKDNWAKVGPLGWASIL
jgi:hypothetical protein